MTAMSIAASKKAKNGVDDTARVSGQGRPLSQAIARVARSIWPTKTDIELRIRTGTSDRRCRDLLAGRSGMSLDAVANLLRSEEGFEFLLALLGDASPDWRRKLEVHIDISLTRFAIEQQRNRIAELETRAGASLHSQKQERLVRPLPKRR